jgi:hypothetical protein
MASKGVNGWAAHVGWFCSYDSQLPVYPYSLSAFLLYFFNKYRRNRGCRPVAACFPFGK